jgi:DNA-binding NarL/FixJ family response regulator
MPSAAYWPANSAAAPGLDCPRHFPCPQSALQALQVEAPPDVVVLDVHLRGTNGVDAIAPLKAAAPGTRVLMLTTFFDHHTEAAARKAGAVGFLLKSYSCQQIAESIRLAGSGPLDAPVAAVGTEALPRKRPEFVPLVERGARLFRAWLRERNRRAAAAGLN